METEPKGNVNKNRFGRWHFWLYLLEAVNSVTPTVYMTSCVL